MSRRGSCSRRFDRRESFGINLDPSHLAHQFLDPAEFAVEFADRIYHVHVKDAKKTLDGRTQHPRQPPELRPARTRLGLRLARATATSTSGAFVRALNAIGYAGPLSIEWEDSGMDRDWGAQDALAFVRRTDFPPSTIAFDQAMQREA